MLKRITLTSFSREDTNFLKGIAILLIMLHNYFRWINPITGENEFGFSALSIMKSWIFIRANPLEIFHVFFNFLGHYGVQAFIFISAYGLTRSFQTNRPGYGKFILHRFDKLYPSLILGAIVFLIFYLIQEGKLIDKALLADLGIQLTLFGNLVPGKAMAISGPWWFYSFIFQFYLIFPLLYRINRRTGWIGLLGLAIAGYLLTWFLFEPMARVQLNPYMNFTGHLPEISLGIFLAGREKVKLPWWLFLTALVMFAGGNVWKWLWPFANLGVTLVLIVVVQGLIRIKGRMKNLASLISWIGIISMYLFACHGFMRSRFVNLANALESPVVSFLIAILFVAVASGVAYLMMQTEISARGWIVSPARKAARTGRFSLLVLLVMGLFTLLFVQSFRSQGKNQGKQEATAFSATHDFEKSIPGRYDIYSDSMVCSGSKSLVLSPSHTFSPGFIVDFDSIDLSGVYELNSSAMIRTAYPDGKLHLVMEISDKLTGKQIEWQSAYVNSGKYTPGKWFLLTYTFKIPAVYLMSDYRIKVYLWNPGNRDWYADDLKLVLKTRR